jgi:DNA-binding transcriptional regulator YhcF (GntR family)
VLGVNSHTVLRAFHELRDEGVLGIHASGQTLFAVNHSEASVALGS